MQEEQSVSVSVFRATHAMFDDIGLQSQPPLSSFRIGAAPAYGGNSIYVAFKDGVVVEVDGGAINVFQNRTVALVRFILSEIR
jgi:hypothetical protein